MTQPKKLIEVAMPVKEVSAECVRDDRIQHGHISSLHKWWARRPLPVCRSVVFASLIPDPLDEDCPHAFQEAVEDLLGKMNNPGDPYKPYDDIPFTSAIDVMDDNERNRLLMFIGKFSSTFCLNEKSGKKTDAKDQISDDSLIKWENKNNERIINIARLLIWVAHNSFEDTAYKELKKQFNDHLRKIRDAEDELYNITDRHLNTEQSKSAQQKLQKAIDAFLDKMPKVFDPFAGGGAIPLEASRLGCRTYGNDINPVAHVIQKASLHFPQKFGKRIIYSKAEFIKIYGKNAFNELPNGDKEFKNGEAISAVIKNQLAFDVSFYAKKALSISEKEIGTFYPTDKNGNAPRVYYWLRVGICMNPSCKAHVPLMKQFYVCNKIGKQVYLNPKIDGTEINFEIKNGKCELEGWIKRGNLICPCCNNVTTSDALKSQFINGVAYDRLGCVINDGIKGKEYAQPSKADIDIVNKVPKSYRPTEKLPVKYTKAMAFCLWGFEEWGQLFSDRQLLAINSLVQSCTDLQFHTADIEYINAIKTYLAIWVDRMAARLTKFGIIDLGGEKVVDLFGLQAIQMVFDYPEINVFKLEQISWIEKYIQSESNHPFITNLSNSSSGEKMQFKEKYITTVVTDPPYYTLLHMLICLTFLHLVKEVFRGYLSFDFLNSPNTESRRMHSIETSS